MFITSFYKQLNNRLAQFKEEDLLDIPSYSVRSLDAGELQKELSFSQALNALVNDEKIIYLASVDFAYLSLALNLYKTSFKKLGIKNYMFVCSDIEAFQELKQQGINSFHYDIQDKDSKTPSNFGTAAFNRKTHIKTKISLDALLHRLTVVIIDVDIVLFKDPLPYFDCQDCDIQIQNDTVQTNSGFYISQPTKASVELFQEAWKIAKQKVEMVNDQHVLNSVMDTMSSNNKLKVTILPKDLFPPGNVYFEGKRRMFYTDNPPKNEVLVHNNWIESMAAKIYWFKEHLLSTVDGKGYYSSQERKYLMYDNYDDGTLETDIGYETDAAETEALKTALLIAHLLNRTVILPTFTCANCVYDACYVKSPRCAFNTNYRIDVFDSVYGNYYREHEFLNNPLVPKSVRRGSDVFLIQPSDGKTWTPTDKIKVLYPQNHDFPTEAEIIMWFSPIKAPVLRFHSLFSIYGNFRNKSFIQADAFDTSTDYRQFRRIDKKINRSK